MLISAISIIVGILAIITQIYYRKNVVIKDVTAEMILEQLPGHIYWKNTQCVLAGSNRYNREDFGISSLSNYIGKTDYDLLSKEDADQVRLTDEEVMRNNEVLTVREHVTTASGEEKLYLSFKNPLLNSKNQIAGVLGCSIDITDSTKATNNKLKMLEDIIAVMPGNVYWLDKNGVYLGCNDNEAEAVGLASRHDIVGKRNIDIPGFVIPEVIDRANDQIMKSGEAIIIEEPAILKDGTEATFLSSKVPLKNDQGEVIGMVGISIDITDRKKQEVELREAKKVAVEANQLKSNFISNMEHDIRSPFVPIVTFSCALSESENDPQKKQYLKFIMDAGNELLNYCNGILDFSRLEAGTLTVLDKKFNLPELLERILKIERITAEHANLTLDFQYDKQIPDVLLGDHVRIERILLNLLSNAIKFTEEGMVTLTVELAAKEDHKVLVRFTVTDTGIGIPTDKQEYIFERFSRLTKSNQGKYKGMGVGLPIVKQFMAELNGEIDLVSDPGKGTTFSCMIPLGIPLSDEILDH
jgi:PAS domain S-box-containing protein